MVKALSPAPGARIKNRTPTVRAAVWDGQTDLAKGNIRFYVDGKQRTRRYMQRNYGVHLPE